jgi:hypothetical protein
MAWLLNQTGLICNATCDLPLYAVVPILLHSQNMQVKYIGLNLFIEFIASVMLFILSDVNSAYIVHAVHLYFTW